MTAAMSTACCPAPSVATSPAGPTAILARPGPAALRHYADEFVSRAPARVALFVMAVVFHEVYFTTEGAIVLATAMIGGELARLAECRLLRAGLAERRPRTAGALTWLAPPLHGLAIAGAMATVWNTPVETTASQMLAIVVLMAFVFDAGFVYAGNRRGVGAQIVVLVGATAILVGGSAVENGLGAVACLQVSALATGIYVAYTHVSDAAAFRSRLAANCDALEETHAELRDAAGRAARLALVSRHATDGIVILTADHVIEWANAAYGTLTGHEPESLYGKRAGVLGSDANDPGVLARITGAMRDGRPVREEVLLRHKAGHDIWIDVAVSPIRDEAGEITGFISVERDVSQRKAREAELAEARRTAETAARAKAAFLATMSHEIRTPLNGLLGTADLLREGTAGGEQRLLVDTITGSAEYLMRIIDNVLESAKLDAGATALHTEPFDLHRLASTSVELLRPVAAQKGIALELDLAEGAPAMVDGDGPRVRQILLNLLGNAVKFTDAGEVRVRLGAVETEGGVCVTIAVSDTGIGIPGDRQEAVFDSFTQADRDTARRFGGTGLGLAISRKLAREMGGDITVQSTLGVGTTFTATIVLGHAAAAPEGADVPEPTPGPAPGPVSPGGAAPPRLLVVDDNKTNRFVIEKMLKATRYELVLAEDGPAAIEAAAARRPDLVLMDISMPGMDGFEACRRIRAAEAGAEPTCILALTANGAPAERLAAREAGMDGFLTKPVRKAALIEAIEERLGGAPSEAPGRAPETAAA